MEPFDLKHKLRGREQVQVGKGPSEQRLAVRPTAEAAMGAGVLTELHPASRAPGGETRRTD